MATTARHLRPIVGSRALGVPKILIPAELRAQDAWSLPRPIARPRSTALAERRRIQLAWFGFSVLRAAFLIAGSVFVLAGMHALALEGGRPFGLHGAIALLAGVAALTVALVWSLLLNEPFARMPTATSPDDLSHRFIH